MEGIPSIESFRKRHQELTTEMSDPDFFSDQRRVAAISREHQWLTGIIGLYEQAEKTEQDLVDNQDLIDDSDTDEELKEMAQEEIAALEPKLVELKDKILVAMLPQDESDHRNIIMEIRAGAGGDEASLFAGVLFRMYSRFAEQRGWRLEQMGSNLSEAGGYKEISFMISGDEVYKTLKFESGVHRVQRIPVTETNGRIHTSTSTVAVLPEAEEVDVVLDPNDLEITVCRASGPGGQGVNTTDSAVQILYKPTGMIVQCADERSQLKNKARALKVLRSRLLQHKQDEERLKYAEHRRGQIGTGDRSERIRTYNFPQSRLTDHRIGYSSHNLEGIIGGELLELTESLQIADNKSKVEALMKENNEVQTAG
ncbi:MAG: peptide chain release factor 1 [Opitutae bacterium]|mgnify:FL=1|nr:peptide chain release factor 1 [Opitutae bacterium]